MLPPPVLPPPSPRARVVGVRRAAGAERERGGDIGDERELDVDTEASPRWRYLAAGIAAAWALGFVLPGMFAWFLAAIPHEMGHATVGCLLGRPSAPAISLAGHAWTGIGERRDALVWVMAIALAIAAYVQRERLHRCVPLAVMALFVPMVAFASTAEVLIAAGGHVGELVFAAYCYAICWSGGRTGTPAERGAGAMAGALLQHGNITLCWGLMHDAAARDLYANNGSLGMKNDYLVLAEDLCNCGLGKVAGIMLVLSVLALPLGIGWGVLQERHRDD